MSKLNLGKILAAIREDKKLSQADVARTLGTSQPTVSRKEKNKADSTIEDVVRVARMRGRGR